VGARRHRGGEGVPLVGPQFGYAMTMAVLRVGLLLAAVLGAVTRPRRLPAWVGPLVATAVALASGAMTPSSAVHALHPLAAPIGFLLAAIPLAVLLDRAGYFTEVAALFEGGRALLPGLWVLAAFTVAVLNLDAAVVLLTPLYVNVGRVTGNSERFLGFQPVILALLASSFLPVSNLTNLIAAAATGDGPSAFLVHLGLPGLVACVVGYWCYRRFGPVEDSLGSSPGTGDHAARSRRGPPDRRVLLIGSGLVVALLVGFLAGPLIGAQPWEVAVVADAVLVVGTRRLPVGAIPWGTALVAAGLGMLATSAASGLSLGSLLGGATGPLGALRIAAVSAAAANIVNNLPALIVALPYVSKPRECSLWPVLLGVNAGPSLLVTGSLASLLWVESMAQLGVPVRARRFLAMGLRVSLPAAAAALGTLVALSPLVGCR
jgi:arsenical pump membrane protein